MRKSSFAAVLLAAAAFGQSTTPADDKPATIGGTVVNAVTGEPVLRAHVSLRGSTMAGTQVRYGAVTDTLGKFSITRLPAGTYSARVERTGFVAGSKGWPITGITLGAGDEKSGIKLQLTPFGSISGRVVDANGDRMEYVAVTAEGANGPVGMSGSTDDRGAYRIGGLRPGRYRIRAAPLITARPPEIRSDGTTETHYVATYHPNTAADASAARVTVQPGGEVTGIDIRLAQGPIVSVSGTVRDVPGSCRVELDLQSGSAGYRVPLVKPDGSYVLWRLDPGRYTISASCVSSNRQTFRSAPLEIDLGSTNLEHVDLRLAPPTVVSGRVEYDGEEVQRGKLQLVVEDFDHRAAVPSAEIGADDTFKLENVVAGRYRIRVAPGPAYVKSVRVGQTTTQGGVLDVRHGVGEGQVTMTLSAATGDVTGTVAADNGPAAGARVMLLPEGSNAGIVPMVTLATPTGVYGFKGIRPGRYKLVALDADDDRSLEDMDELVEHIEVSPRDQLMQDLTVPSQFLIGVRK